MEKQLHLLLLLALLLRLPRWPGGCARWMPASDRRFFGPTTHAEQAASAVPSLANPAPPTLAEKPKGTEWQPLATLPAPFPSGQCAPLSLHYHCLSLAFTGFLLTFP